MPTQKDPLHVVMTNVLRDLTDRLEKPAKDKSYPGLYGDVLSMLDVICTIAENGKIPAKGSEELVQALENATKAFRDRLGLRCDAVIASIRAQAEAEEEAETEVATPAT